MRPDRPAPRRGIHTLEDMMANYSLFRPRDRENNFILSVAMTTVKMLFFVVLLIGVAARGVGRRRGQGVGGHLPHARSGRAALPVADLVHLRQVRGTDHRIQGLGEPHLRGTGRCAAGPHRRGRLYRGRALLGAQRHRHQAHRRRSSPHLRARAGGLRHHPASSSN